MWQAAHPGQTRCCTPSFSCRKRSPSAKSMRVTRAGVPGSATTSNPDVPDYDPLTISDEELKKLPPAEGGAPPPPPAAAAAPAPATPAPPTAGAAPSGGPTPSGTQVSAPAAPTAAAAAPAKPAE